MLCKLVLLKATQPNGVDPLYVEILEGHGLVNFGEQVQLGKLFREYVHNSQFMDRLIRFMPVHIYNESKLDKKLTWTMLFVVKQEIDWAERTANAKGDKNVECELLTALMVKEKEVPACFEFFASTAFRCIKQKMFNKSDVTAKRFFMKAYNASLELTSANDDVPKKEVTKAQAKFIDATHSVANHLFTIIQEQDRNGAIQLFQNPNLPSDAFIEFILQFTSLGMFTMFLHDHNLSLFAFSGRFEEMAKFYAKVQDQATSKHVYMSLNMWYSYSLAKQRSALEAFRVWSALMHRALEWGLTDSMRFARKRFDLPPFVNIMFTSQFATRLLRNCPVSLGKKGVRLHYPTMIPRRCAQIQGIQGLAYKKVYLKKVSAPKIASTPKKDESDAHDGRIHKSKFVTLTDQPKFSKDLRTKDLRGGGRQPRKPAAPKNTTAPKNPKNPKNPKDRKNPEDPKNPKDPKNPATPKDPKNPATPKDPKNPATPKDPKNPATPNAPLPTLDVTSLLKSEGVQSWVTTTQMESFLKIVTAKYPDTEEFDGYNVYNDNFIEVAGFITDRLKSCERLLFPVCYKNHWRLILLQENLSVYYDPQSKMTVSPRILQMLAHRNVPITRLDAREHGTPRQKDNDSCGIYVMAMTMAIAEKRKIHECDFFSVLEIRRHVVLLMMEHYNVLFNGIKLTKNDVLQWTAWTDPVVSFEDCSVDIDNDSLFVAMRACHRRKDRQEEEERRRIQEEEASKQLQEKEKSDSSDLDDVQLPDRLDEQLNTTGSLLHNTIPQMILVSSECVVYKVNTERIVPRKKIRDELHIQKKENKENKQEMKQLEVKEATQRKRPWTEENDKKLQSSEARMFLLISDAISEKPPSAELIIQRLSNMGIHFEPDDIASTRSLANGLKNRRFVATFYFKDLAKGNECATRLQSEQVIAHQFAMFSGIGTDKDALMVLESPDCYTFSVFFAECFRQIEPTIQNVMGLVKGDWGNMQQLLEMIGKQKSQEVMRDFSKKGQRSVHFGYKKIFGTKDITFWIA